MSDDIQKAHDPCSHLANAHRIVEHYGDQLLYVEGIGWHVWHPPWRADELGARRVVHGLGAIIAQEAAGMAQWVADASSKADREDREKAMNMRFKWAGTSESAQTLEQSMRMASTLLNCKAVDLDANPMLLGTPSGVLDLGCGNYRPHDQRDRITKTTGCEFDRVASAETWKRFVSAAMGGDPDLIGYVQRLCGYMLSGARGEHLLPILWGNGANGKSTFLGAMQSVLGDYAGTAAPGLLIQRHGTEHPTALADLQGKRMMVVSETGEAGRLNEEQAKLLTGGDTITARRMRMDFFQFEPSHQLILQTNHRPRVAGTDQGLWRRLRLIPFAVTVPKDKRDPHLPEKLRAELPGILSWCLDGWKNYRTHGFNYPEAVRAATSDYRESSDIVGEFLSECCDMNPNFTESAGNLYHAYQDWCGQVGERSRSQREFGMRLGERGFVQARTGSSRRWRGLGLHETSQSDANDAYTLILG